jgi:Fic family protein
VQDHPAGPAWPPVAYETLPWRSTPAPGTASRAQIRKHQGPYRAAVTPAIAGAQLHLPANLASALDDATNEIARFDAELGAEIAPFAAILLRSESAASSQIENLTASARAIAEAELDIAVSGNAANVVANSRAMTAALHLADRLDADAILQMHQALRGRTTSDVAGKWRGEQVWIGGGAVGPHRAMFVPPRHDLVPAAIDDLIEFIARDDLPVLAQAALAHAQFETIHPFPDGNGRTGRALVHALLRAKRLTRTVTVPVSAGLLIDVDAYFDALGAYRNGDASPIINRFIDAAFSTTANGRRLADDLHAIRESWNSSIKARKGAGAWKLADVLLRQPVVDRDTVSRELGVTGTNVYGPLKALVAAGILTETTNKKRGQIWRSAEVITALDAFAARSGRRTPPQHT